MSFEGFPKDAGVDSQESCGSLDIRGRWAHRPVNAAESPYLSWPVIARGQPTGKGDCQKESGEEEFGEAFHYAILFLFGRTIHKRMGYTPVCSVC